MPKIPIVLMGPIPQKPLPDIKVPLAAFQGDLGGMIAEGVAGVARAVSAAAGQAAEVNDRIAHEQSRDEAARLSSDVPAQVEQLHQGVQQPFHPETNKWGFPEGEQGSQTLTERFAKGMAELRTSTLQGVTTKYGGRFLGRYLEQVSGAASAHAQGNKFQLFRSEQAREVSETLFSMANALIGTTDPGLREHTMRNAQAYIESKETLSPKEKGQLIQTLREDVEIGTAQRAIDRNPDADLSSVVGKVSPEHMLKLEHYQRAARERQSRELHQAQVALDRGMIQYREGVERWMVKGLAAGTLTEEDLDSYSEHLTSEKLATYQQALRDRQVQGGPGDADTIRAFKSAVYSPRLNDERQVVELSTQLEGAFNAKLVPESVFTPMLSHLQGLRDRFSQRTERAGAQRAGQEERAAVLAQSEKERIADAVYGDTQTLIRQQLKSTKGMLQDLDAATEESLTRALEDLARETGRGRLQNAAAWWEASRARYLAPVSNRADQRMTELANSLSRLAPPALRKDPMASEFDEAVKELLARKASYPSEAEWRRDVRAVRDRKRLAEEMKRLRDLQKPTP